MVRKNAGAGLLLHPSSVIVISLLLVAFAFALRNLPIDWDTYRSVCRYFGYVALLALVIPYLYVVRRLVLHRFRGNLTRWMQWHVGSSYLALAVTLIHSRAHAHGQVAFCSMVLFWTVMISGVLGFLGQKLLYRVMALVVKEELGLEGLDPERRRLSDAAAALIGNYSLLTVNDIRDWQGFCGTLRDAGVGSNGASRVPALTVAAGIWECFPEKIRELAHHAVAEHHFGDVQQVAFVEALNDILKPENKKKFFRKQDLAKMGLSPEAEQLLKKSHPTDREAERLSRLVLEACFPKFITQSQPPAETVRRFFEEQVSEYLRSDFGFWKSLFSRPPFEPVPKNYYLQLRKIIDPEQRRTISQLWKWVRRRRKMDVEHCIHVLARIWLLVHGPAAAALAVLVAAHVLASIYYGGP